MAVSGLDVFEPVPLPELNAHYILFTYANVQIATCGVCKGSDRNPQLLGRNLNGLEVCEVPLLKIQKSVALTAGNLNNIYTSARYHTRSPLDIRYTFEHLSQRTLDIH